MFFSLTNAKRKKHMPNEDKKRKYTFKYFCATNNNIYFELKDERQRENGSQQQDSN